MDRVTVSENAVEVALRSEALSLPREKWRRLKNASREDFLRYIVMVYKEGFQAGCDAITDRIKADHVESYDPDTEEVQIDWQDILDLIGEVKGIGPKLKTAIDEKLREVY